MNRSISTPRVLRASLFIVCYCLLVFTAAAQEIRFRFDPPEDFPAYISTFKSKQTTDMGALGKRTVASEGRAQITVDKNTDGYSVTFAPLSFTMTENGQPVENPILAFVQNITVTYELDVDGELVEISGLEGLFEEFIASLPAELPPNIAEMVNEEAFRNKTVQEWQGRIGQFVGADVEIGELWASVDEMPLPTGESMAFYSLTKFAEQVKFDDADCVRIQFSYNTDADELKEFMGELWENLADMVGSEDLPSVSDAKIVGEGERIIDPTTMLIYLETGRRTWKTTVDIPGRGAVEMVRIDEREYGYEKIAP